MRINELCIGNYVNFRGIGEVCLTEIREGLFVFKDNNCNCSEYSRALKPIKLDNDRLTSIGFTKTFWYFITKNWVLNGVKINIYRVKNLHSLQNLYFIYNQEALIK